MPPSEAIFYLPIQCDGETYLTTEVKCRSNREGYLFHKIALFREAECFEATD